MGAVGSGKSTLLSAILGDCFPCAAGGSSKATASVSVHSSVAFCSQQPWIYSGSVRSNVCFGLAFDQARFDSAVAACALDQDISAFPAGDATEIGERGINLSGGQVRDTLTAQL